MSFSLMKVFIKKNWKLWSIFTSILLMYMFVMILSFDQMKEMMDTLGGNDPEMMGIVFMLDSRFDLLASMYFDMLIFIFPMVFYIMLANKIVSKTVDDNSMSAYLASSLSRSKYTTTAAVFLILSITSMFFVIFAFGGLGLICFETLNWLNWANMVFTTLTCTLAIAAICFFFSCVMAANKTGNVLLTGIPIVFVLFMWLGEMPSLEFLLKLTPMGYIDTVMIGKGLEDLWWLINLVFIAIASVLFVISIKMFKKKQLSI